MQKILKVLIGVQARSDSKRLPGKIYEAVGPKSILEWIWGSCKEAERRARARGIEAVTVVLGPRGDLRLQDFCDQKKIECYLATNDDPDDLIRRYQEAMKKFGAEAAIRVTGDCLQTATGLVEDSCMLLQEADYVANTIHRSYMEGMDVQGASAKGWAWFDEHQREERQHPFCFFDKNQILRDEFERRGLKYLEIINPKAEWLIHTSIDTIEDLELARKIYAETEKTNHGVDGKKQAVSSPRIHIP